MYFNEKEREMRSQKFLREAENERRLSHLPRHRGSMSRRAAGKLGVLLLKLGTRLKQFERSVSVLEDLL